MDGRNNESSVFRMIYFFSDMYKKFIDTARVLEDPEIVKPLPILSVKFSMSMLTYKLTPLLCKTFFNFNEFVNNG